MRWHWCPASAKGGCRASVAAWQLRSAPRTIGNRNHAASAVVDHNPVGWTVRPVVYQAVWTIVSVWMLPANGLHIRPHHFAAVVRHRVISHRTGKVRNGSGAENTTLPIIGHRTPCRTADHTKVGWGRAACRHTVKPRNPSPSHRFATGRSLSLKERGERPTRGRIEPQVSSPEARLSYRRPSFCSAARMATAWAAGGLASAGATGGLALFRRPTTSWMMSSGSSDRALAAFGA